jgi:hypothetical protein
MPRLRWRTEFAAAARRINTPEPPARTISLLAGWAGLSKRALAPAAKIPPLEDSAPVRVDEFARVEPEGEDIELAGILGGIAEEVRHQCAAICAGI